MVAIYREILLMFVNFAKIYLELHLIPIVLFGKNFLDTPSYNCMYIYWQVCRPVKIVHKNVFSKIW